MTLSEVVLAALLSLPPKAGDGEGVEARTARMGVLADAIAYASENSLAVWGGSQRDLALLLVSKGWWESRFARNVHAGQCRAFECDAFVRNGVVYHRARSPWQLQRTSYVRAGEWSTLEGVDLESTKTAALVAARIFGASLKRCGTIRGALAGYATGRCSWSGAARRYKTFLDLKAKFP